jgi:hypothetical protein
LAHQHDGDDEREREQGCTAPSDEVDPEAADALRLFP